MKLLELTSDIVFKAFMMSKNTNRYKAKLINLITGIPEIDLMNATYESNELAIANKSDKVYKTDIIVKVNKNIISIEMNKNYYQGLFIKNATYANKLESEQFGSGDNYLNYSKIIQINIDNFHKFKGNKLLYKFTMREVDTNELENNLLESYHIDLTYLNRICYTECKNELERFCFMFKDNIKDIEGEIKMDDIMDEAYEELERISSDKNIIGLYDKEKIEQKIMNTRLLDAELKGKEEGKKEGIQQRNIEIARNMLKKDININDIIEITGLTKDQIEELK